MFGLTIFLIFKTGNVTPVKVKKYNKTLSVNNQTGRLPSGDIRQPYDNNMFDGV